MSGVLICGAYGAGHIGDEAFLYAIVGTLRGIDPAVSICVVTRAPEKTRRLYNVSAVHTFDFFGIHNAMKKAKLFISGGGSLIQNVTSRRSLRYYLWTLRHAKKCGCKVLMYGCGVGPLDGKSDIRRTAETINRCVDAVTLRDRLSAELLRKIGVTKPEVTLAADPVLSLDACSQEEADDFLSKSGVSPEGDYALFCLRPWQGLDEHLDAVVQAINFAHDALGLTPVFMTLNRSIDLETAHRAAGAADAPCVILPAVTSAELCMGVMKKMRLVVSMRMHAVLFAAAVGVPTVGISYDPKVAGFMDYADCGKCVELKTLTGDELCRCMVSELKCSKAEQAQRMDNIKAVEALNGRTAERFLKVERKTE